MNILRNNCTDVDRLMKQYYLPVTYSLICIVGLLGNVVALSIYLTQTKPWKSSSIIMVNLALNDLLYMLTIPFLVYYYSNRDSWTLPSCLCHLVRFSFHFHLYASILFLTWLGVFRYAVVMHPLRAAQLQQRFWGAIVCLAVWTVTAAETAPVLLYVSSHDKKNTSCIDFASTDPVEAIREYSWALTAFGFVLPLLVVFTCNVGIMRKLATGPTASSSCRSRARRTIALILVVFVTCFLPYHVLRVLWIEVQNRAKARNGAAASCGDQIVHAAYIVSRPVAAVNTFFNLVLYTLSGNKFRTAFRGVFCRGCWPISVPSVLKQFIINRRDGDKPAT